MKFKDAFSFYSLLRVPFPQQQRPRRIGDVRALGEPMRGHHEDGRRPGERGGKGREAAGVRVFLDDVHWRAMADEKHGHPV